MWMRTRSPGSVWRTNTTWPSRRATQWPPCAIGPTSTIGSAMTTVPEAAADVTRRRTAAAQPLLGAAGGAELIGHARDHDAGHEQQPALEPQRGLVVQQLLPPPAHDVLGDVDRDDVAGARLAELLDVADHGSHELAVGRVDDLERDRDLQVLPLLHQRLGLGRVELHRQRLDRVGPRHPGVRQCAHRRLVELADQDDRVDARRQRDVGVVDLELGGDPVVVAADRPHQQEHRDHRRRSRSRRHARNLVISTMTSTVAVMPRPIELTTRTASSWSASAGPARS